MSDQLSIHNLICKYARLVDDGDFDGVGELFSAGKLVFLDDTNPTEVSGSKNITSLYETTTRCYEDGTPKTHHVTSNIELQITGDTALGNSYFTVFQQLPDFPLQAIIAGYYHDEFTKENTEWSFTSRSIKVTLVGDISHHLLISLT